MKTKKRKIIIVLFIAISLMSCNHTVVNKEKTALVLQEALEYAYFEGQRDFANGDIRIEWITDSCWTWTKSPWNDGTPPIYDITLIKEEE